MSRPYTYHRFVLRSSGPTVRMLNSVARSLELYGLDQPALFGCLATSGNGSSQILIVVTSLDDEAAAADLAAFLSEAFGQGIRAERGFDLSVPTFPAQNHRARAQVGNQPTV